MLSFTSWDGIGGIDTAKWIGTENYHQVAHDLPAVLAGGEAQPRSGSAYLTFVATPFGLFLAYQLDKEIRGSRIYQSIFFLPVVLSFAIIGFIWPARSTRRPRASSTASSGTGDT